MDVGKRGGAGARGIALAALPVPHLRCGAWGIYFLNVFIYLITITLPNPTYYLWEVIRE